MNPPLDDIPGVRAAAAAAARRHRVLPDLHEEDFLLRFLMFRMGRSPEAGVDAYFDGGADDAARLGGFLPAPGTGARILEFASGFGRVTRHLGPYRGQLLASDIHAPACRFVTRTIGFPATQSATRPHELRIGGSFDFVFVLSLFSHLPDRSFGPWLGRLYRLLVPGGRLLFTTHGDHAIATNRMGFKEPFDHQRGFVFGPDSDQSDLSSDDYGTMTVDGDYVRRAVAGHTDGRVVSHRPGAWWSFQDEWIIDRPA